VHYNLGISAIEELGQKDADSLAKLKIMHSPSLRNLRGLAAFSGLKHLNLSSNSI
jgi:hypothetical protein